MVHCVDGYGQVLFQCCDVADTHSGMDRATYFRRCNNGGLPRYAFLATLTQISISVRAVVVGQCSRLFTTH